jgi:hypothetical protein
MATRCILASMLRLAPALAFGLVLAAVPAARADVVPPDVAACDGKTAGAPCTPIAGSPGTCKASKCSRLDYSKWDRDASPSPPSVTYDCLTCAAGADAGTDGDAGSTQPASSDDSSGCSFAVRRAGPWALALVPALVLAFLERRRSRR